MARWKGYRNTYGERKDGSFSTFQSGDIIELSIDTEKGITMAAGETYEGSKPVAKQGTPYIQNNY